METKLTKIGLISGLVGTAIMGVGAIVAECRRHKAKKELTKARIVIWGQDLDIALANAQISILEKQLEKAKSECQGGES